VGIEPRLCSCITVGKHISRDLLYLFCWVVARLEAIAHRCFRTAETFGDLRPGEPGRTPFGHTAIFLSAPYGSLVVWHVICPRHYPQAFDNATQRWSTGLMPDGEAPRRRQWRSGAYRYAATRPTSGGLRPACPLFSGGAELRYGGASRDHDNGRA
jgi:hypothetical protein